jgi:hypothetical protein
MRYRPKRLFLEYEEASGETLTPEIFARADGTVWACAVSSTAALPVDPSDVAGRRRGACAAGGAVPALSHPPLRRHRSSRDRPASVP